MLYTFLNLCLKQSTLIFCISAKCLTQPKKTAPKKSALRGAVWAGFMLMKIIIKQANFSLSAVSATADIPERLCFFSRRENMYVIILTNATHFANMKNNFNGYDYSKTTCKMREDIHNAIYADLSEQGMIG